MKKAIRPLLAAVVSGWMMFLMGAPAGAVPQWCAGPTASRVGPSAGATNFGGGGSAGYGGGYFAPRRGPSSRGELQIPWQYPVFTDTGSAIAEAGKTEGRSIAVEAKRALSLEEAYKQVAGDDPRPLLVLRECLTCTGTDDALMTRAADNEKTMLMARWFHCVKLPPAVIEEDHPFHALFEGDEPSHLFVATTNGELRQDLNGAQSRTELWSDMEEILAATYAKKHVAALKRLQKLLNEFDEVDVRVAELDAKLARQLEKDGPGSKKVKKLQMELTDLEDERAELRSQLSKASALPLKEKEEGEHAAVETTVENGGDAAA